MTQQEKDASLARRRLASRKGETSIRTEQRSPERTEGDDELKAIAEREWMTAERALAKRPDVETKHTSDQTKHTSDQTRQQHVVSEAATR